MLVEFSVGNFLSFKNRVTLSMVAGTIKEHDGNNTVKINELRLLKSASIYGANASGKSNLINALRFMKEFVIESSSNSNITEKIQVENFKLSTFTEKEPSFFEIIFYVENTLYRYNFEVTQERVISENLYFMPSKKEATLFSRDLDNINIKKYFKSEGKSLEQKTRPNALFLSVVAQFNGEKATKILKWFDDCDIISGLRDSYMKYTINFLQSDENRLKINSFIKKMDVAIDEINLNESIVTLDSVRNDLPDKLIEELSKTAEPIKALKFISKHKKYDSERKQIGFADFDFDINESAGTRKLLALAGLILESQIKQKVIIIDELDARLHPLLSIELIKIFNSNLTNINKSQFIFTTHDVKLMNSNLLRRDQIWFTSKDQCESTDLYSLVEYKKGIRNDEVFEKNYMQGRYGGIPYISDIRNSFNC